MKVALTLLAAGAALLAPQAAWSQSQTQAYPSKPVRIMVGYTPGGGVDTTARMVGQALNELWGSTVIIENRPAPRATSRPSTPPRPRPTVTRSSSATSALTQ